MTPVNLFIALILSTVVGAFTGLLLGGFIVDLYVAIIAALLATIIVGNVHNLRNPQVSVIFSAVQAGSGVSSRAIVGSVIATLVGGVVAVQLVRLSEFNWPVAVGALSGLFAGILMAIFMVLYGMGSRTGQSRPNP
jgi:hypothetical protein